jgi:hypothetical protein
MPKGGPQICLYVPAEDDEFKSLPIKAHWTTRGCTCKFYRCVLFRLLLHSPERHRQALMRSVQR